MLPILMLAAPAPFLATEGRESVLATETAERTGALVRRVRQLAPTLRLGIEIRSGGGFVAIRCLPPQKAADKARLAEVVRLVTTKSASGDELTGLREIVKRDRLARMGWERGYTLSDEAATALPDFNIRLFPPAVASKGK